MPLTLAAAVLAGLAGAILLPAPAANAPTRVPAPLPLARAGGEPIIGCVVVDGDTLRCNGERVRLLGIDAPERPGGCQPGRKCAPGGYYASRLSLSDALIGNLRIQRLGKDRYGRTLALVRANGGDLSCIQLKRGQATYRSDWDNEGRLAAICEVPSD